MLECIVCPYRLLCVTLVCCVITAVPIIKQSALNRNASFLTPTVEQTIFRESRDVECGKRRLHTEMRLCRSWPVEDKNTRVNRLSSSSHDPERLLIKTEVATSEPCFVSVTYRLQDRI